jgi:outer membrane protein TolC
MAAVARRSITTPAPDGHPYGLQARRREIGAAGSAVAAARYVLRAWDGTMWVQWTATDPEATPAATSPPASGALSRISIIATL